MGGKHLKRLRAEKSKVKFKNKHLPKGQNITNTNFQVKKIVTVEQFKKVEENEPLSSWNLSLKDLLNRLNHYNYTSRLNSLTNLKDLIFKYPTLLEGPSLQSIINGILALLVDVEHKIRITAIKLIEDIFNRLQNKSIALFHDILKLYLDCAMTHREFSIQQDSLKFVDVIIKFASEAIKKNSGTLIYNFTRILSNYNYGHHSDAVLSKKSKQDLENFKTEMFVKFYKLLKIIYKSPIKNNGSKNIFEVKSSQCRFNLKRCNDYYHSSPDLSNLFRQSSEKEYISENSKSSEFQNQISIIMPLLFDTWLEFGQQDGCLNKGNELLLQSLLKIILLLYDEIVLNNSQLKNWFIATYANSFIKTFMTNFPYQESLTEIVPVIYGKNYAKQNLILCYLFYCFKIKHQQFEKETEVDNYILSCLNQKNLNGMKILPKIVEILLICGKKRLYNDLLIAVIKVYDSTENLKLQQRLFNILLKEVLTNKETNTELNQYLLNWKVSLFKKLLEKEVDVNIIKGIIQIVIQEEGNEMLQEIQKNVHKIIKSLSYVKFGETNLLEGKKLIAHLLYLCKPEILQQIIEEKLLEDINPQVLKNYFLNIFSYKLQI